MKRKIAILLIAACSAGWVKYARAETNQETQTQTRAEETLTDTLRVETSRRGFLVNSLDVLNGQAAGVTVGSSTNPEAMLSSVRVRGNHSLTGGNEPLVIIDGMSSDLRTLSTIFPGDIESFTILKDASQTAQYGARGAAGVIEVHTRRGSEGRFHISYAGDVGFAHADRFLPMLTADEYRTVTNAHHMTIVDNGGSTDWQRAIIRTGLVQNHHIALGGGNSTANYRASLSYSETNSIVQNLGTRNFTSKVDVTQYALDKRLTFDLGLFGAISNNRYADDVQKLWYSAAAFNPTFPMVTDGSDNFTAYVDASQINHPQSLLNIKKHNDAMHFNTSLAVTGDIGYGLTARIYGSYSYDADEESRFYPTYIASTGQVYRGAGKTNVWMTNFRLQYVYDESERHHVEAELLGEMQGRIQTDFHVTVNRLASNAFGYDNLAIGALRLWDGTGSYHERQQLLSAMGRVAYTALGRYSLNVTARGDGGSVAGAGHKWGFFPSVSAAWDIKREPWLQDVDALTRLKISAGWGMSGNLGGIAAYQSLQLLRPTGIIQADGMPDVILGITQNANSHLTWEKTQTTNAGVELGLWHNRLVIMTDYYYSYIYDMLYNYTVSVPPFLYDKLLANLGTMENTGVEVGLALAAVQSRDWDLNIGINLTWQHNRLLSLDGYYQGEYLTAPTYTPIASVNGAGLHGGNTDVVYQIPGQPLGVFYLPHCTGLTTQANGEQVYEVADLDGDGLIDLSDGGDRQVCGQATPKVLLGSNISVRYKQFDLSIQFNGAFGHKIFNGSALSYMNMGSLPYYNVMRGANEANINDLTVTDYWLERGDYVNIDYVTLGWSLPCKPEWRLSALRLSVSVNNLATITAYSGLTPIINSTVIDGTLGVDDKRSYPVARTYSFSLQIQL